MTGSKMQMNRLIEERDKLAREIEAKKNELFGLERAIALLQRDDEEQRGAIRRRMAIKEPVLKLMEEHLDGLTVAEVLDAGKAKGLDLDRASVSSLLSRLKKDDVLTLDSASSKYRLVRPPRSSEVKGTAQVVAQASVPSPVEASVQPPAIPPVRVGMRALFRTQDGRTWKRLSDGTVVEHKT